MLRDHMTPMERFADYSNEELAALYQSGHDREDCLEVLFKRNRGFIVKTIQRHTAADKQTLEDLIQESFFAVREAAETYRDDTGAKYLTHLLWRLRHAIVVFQTRETLCHVPQYFLEKVIKYKMIRGEGYSDEKLLEVLQCDRKALTRIKHLAKGLDSLDRQIGHDLDDITLGDTLASDDDVSETVVDEVYDQHRREVVQKILHDTLNEENRQIINLTIGEDLSIKDTAAAVHLSETHVKAVKAAALRRLRKSDVLAKLREELEIEEGRSYHCSNGEWSRDRNTVENIAIRHVEGK